MEKRDVLTTREVFRQRLRAHQKALWQEMERLTDAAAELVYTPDEMEQMIHTPPVRLISTPTNDLHG